MTIVLLVWVGIGVVFCLAVLLAAARPKPTLKDNPESLHRLPTPESSGAQTSVNGRLSEAEPVAFSASCNSR